MRRLPLLLLLLLAHCASRAVPEVNDEMARRTAVEPERLENGRAIYLEKCHRCHEQVPPGKLDPDLFEMMLLNVRTRDERRGDYNAQFAALGLARRRLLEIAGKDLVAMSVNDILTTGGDPLLFLDYIGIAALDEARITRLIAGMADYLESCNCILAGGETAEMPGIVPEDVIELSGFCIGCAEKSELIDPTTIAVGDVLVGYASNSIHANGWSLVRRVLREHPGELADSELLGLLEPTRLYDDVVAGLRGAGIRPRAMSHITGGGLPENLERLFRGCGAELEIPRWELPGIDKLLRHVDAEDRFHTFNMGIGWVAIVSPEDADAAAAAGPGGVVIGRVVPEEGVRVAVRGE